MFLPIWRPNRACWFTRSRKAPYLRVKVWRWLQRVGAVAVKSSVYVVPDNEQSRAEFEWMLREIVRGGGDGF